MNFTRYRSRGARRVPGTMNKLESRIEVTNQFIRVIVPQAAMGAPRQTRADAWKKRPCVLAYRAWCDLLRIYCPVVPPAESVELVRIDAFYAPPESWSATKRAAAIGKRKRTKPDGDNCAKGVCDALWKQDAALGGLAVERWWGERDETRIEIHLVAGV